MKKIVVHLCHEEVYIHNNNDIGACFQSHTEDVQDEIFMWKKRKIQSSIHVFFVNDIIFVKK